MYVNCEIARYGSEFFGLKSMCSITFIGGE